MNARPGLVLLTADTVGGVWTHAVELSAALAERGVRVALATMGAPLGDAQRAQVAPIANLSVHESAYRLEWMEEPWDDVARAGEWLLRLERELRPDLVHLNQFAFGALPFASPSLLVAHSCVCSWWQAVHGEPAPARWDRYRAAVSAGLRGATLVGAPTRTMLATLRRNYDVPVDGVVLPNGRAAQQFPGGRKEPVVMAAGRMWDAAKNLAALEAVAADVPWPIRVAGSNRHPDGGTRTLRGVVALGELPPERLAAELARAAIFALPARYEPFGLAALEAALARCALVLGDIPSLREIWGDAALFVPPDDHVALAAALRALAADDRRRERLADAAHARALGFSPEGMAAAYLGAYARLPRAARPDVPQPREEPASCAS